MACAILILAAAPLAAAELVLSAGAFNLSSDKSEAELGLGVRLPPDRWRITPGRGRIAPEIGAAATGKGAFYLFGGLRRDFEVAPGWAIAPFWGVSLYEEGSGRDLGGAIEFRSGIELSRASGDRGRLGLAFYHLSNAGIYDRNPGSNSLVLTWAWRRARR